MVNFSRDQYLAYTAYLHDFIMRAFFDSIGKPLRILDFGCGQGLLMHYLQQTFYTATLIGYDCDAQQIEKNRLLFPKLTFVHGTLPLPFDTASFDLVYLVQVIHHIDKEKHAAYLAELARIIKPNGYLIIIEPNKKNIFERYRFSQEHMHERMILVSELIPLLSLYNFKKSELFYLYPWLARTHFLFLEKYCYSIPAGQLYCLITQKGNQ